MKLSKATTAQKSAEAAKLPEGYDGVLRNHQQALNNFTRHINASDLPLAMMSLDYALNSFKLRPEDRLKAYKTIGEKELGFGDDDIFIKKENLTRHLKNFVEKEDYALMIRGILNPSVEYLKHFILFHYTLMIMVETYDGHYLSRNYGRSNIPEKYL